MKAALLALAAIPAAAAAQTLPQPVNVGPALVGPSDLRPRLLAPPPCLSNAIIGEEVSGEIIGEKVIGEKVIGEKVIGEKGSGEVIGEKGSGDVIGEKGSGEIIGEKGSGEIIGEKGVGPSATKSIGGRWAKDGTRTFRHVLWAPGGRTKVTLMACSTARGGEKVHFAAEGTGLRQSLLATAAGNAASAEIIVPQAVPGKMTGVPLLVNVETLAGTPAAAGAYRIIVTQ